jgi:hypothetical protein
MLARIPCSMSLENGRNICLDAALSGLILPPSCFRDKTGLKTSEDAACQMPDIIAARRNFQGGGNKNKHLFYPNVTLLLLFLLPIFTVPNPASVLNSVPYITSPKPHYLRHHIKLPSLLTYTHDIPQHLNTSLSPR